MRIAFSRLGVTDFPPGKSMIFHKKETEFFLVSGQTLAMPGSAAGGKSEDNRKISLKRQSPGMGPMLSGSNSKTTTPLHHVAAVVQPHIKEEVKPTLFSCTFYSTKK